MAALFHIRIDEICSSNPALKAQLKFFANKAAEERAISKRKKRNRKTNGSGEKGKKKTVDPAKEFLRFLKKAMEFQALAEDVLK